jgi:5-deoxy-D-glucuronate isomerase
MRRLLNDGSGLLVQVITILNGDRCTYPTTHHDHLLSPVQSTDRETHHSARKPTHAHTVRSAVHFTVHFTLRRLLNDG